MVRRRRCRQVRGRVMRDREPRRKVTIRARMIHDAGSADICIADISARGLLLITERPPPRGTYVEIVTTGPSIVGSVVWSKGRRCGVRCRDRINLTAVLNGIAQSDEKKVERSAPRLAMRAAAPRVQDDARSVGRALEFAFLVAIGCALAGAMGTAVYHSMSPTLSIVSQQLRQPDGN